MEILMWIWTWDLQITGLELYHYSTKTDGKQIFLTSIWSVKNVQPFLIAKLIDGFIPAHNISRQFIKTAKYITTTFAYHSTSYLFKGTWQSLTRTADQHSPSYACFPPSPEFQCLGPYICPSNILSVMRTYNHSFSMPTQYSWTFNKNVAEKSK